MSNSAHRVTNTEETHMVLANFGHALFSMYLLSPYCCLELGWDLPECLPLIY